MTGRRVRAGTSFCWSTSVDKRTSDSRADVLGGGVPSSGKNRSDVGPIGRDSMLRLTCQGQSKTFRLPILVQNRLPALMNNP
jgi:hypothetical protein